MSDRKKEFSARVSKDWQSAIKKRLSLAKFKACSRTYERDGVSITVITIKGSNHNTVYRNTTVEQNYYEHLLSMYLQTVAREGLYGI